MVDMETDLSFDPVEDDKETAQTVQMKLGELEHMTVVEGVQVVLGGLAYMKAVAEIVQAVFGELAHMVAASVQAQLGKLVRTVVAETAQMAVAEIVQK